MSAQNGADRGPTASATGGEQRDYVTMTIEIPKDISAEEEDLIKKLKEIREKKQVKKKGGIFG